MNEREIMDRLMRLETVVGIGDDKRGILTEMEQMRLSIEELKRFQMKALGGFGFAILVLQVVVPLIIKNL